MALARSADWTPEQVLRALTEAYLMMVPDGPPDTRWSAAAMLAAAEYPNVRRALAAGRETYALEMLVGTDPDRCAQSAWTVAMREVAA